MRQSHPLTPVQTCSCGEVATLWGGAPQPRLFVRLHRIKVVQSDEDGTVFLLGMCKCCSREHRITKFCPPFSEEILTDVRNL